MRIDYEGKTEFMGSDLVYTWFIESAINSYRLSLSFLGCFDEDGKEDIETLTSQSIIELTEIDHHDPKLLTEVKSMLKNDMDVEIGSDVVMINAPKNLEYLETRDETSYPSTMAKYQLYISAITNVLTRHEMKGEILS